MKIAPIPVNEYERLRALYALNVLNTKPDEVFNRVTRICRELFHAESSAVCFVDDERVWLKSTQGISATEIPRSTSICGHTICQAVSTDVNSRICEITDTKQDARFEDNPLVMDEPKIRYYMAFILQSTSGENLGTLCILDKEPRKASDQERRLFIDLGLMLQEKLNEIAVDSNFNLEDVALVSNITYRVFEEMNTLLKKRGISIMEWRVLDKVAQLQIATPSKISQQIGLSPSQISKMIGNLESKGLIERMFNVDDDRRVTQLKCNKRGRDIWQYGQRIGDQVVNQLRDQ